MNIQDSQQSLRKQPKVRFPEFTKEWETKKLGDILKVKKTRNNENNFDREDVLSVSGSLGIVNQVEHLGRSYAGVSLENYHVVDVGDIVYTKSPIKSNPYGIFKANKRKPGIVSTLYAVYTVKDNYDFNFVDRYFELDDRTNRYLRPLVHKGAKNDMKISDERVLIDDVVFPRLPEQIKIEKLFSSIDELIINLQSQYKNLLLYRAGVLQSIFSREIQFKDPHSNFFPDWKNYEIGDLIIEYREKSSFNNEYPVLTSSRYGLIRQSDYYSEDNRITEKDNTGFNIIPENHLTYRSRSDDGVFHFNQNTLGFTGLVSTYYPVFKTRNSDDKFLIYYLNYSWKHIYKYSVGTSQKVLSITELKKIKLDFPVLEEQRKIAEFIYGIDKLLSSKQKKITIALQWKKGLLQSMFV